MEECEPQEIPCPEFKSSVEEYGRYTNKTNEKLAAATYCKIKVDARDGTARVIIEARGNIGIDNLPKGQGSMYDSGDVITFLSGENEIILYNA